MSSSSSSEPRSASAGPSRARTRLRRPRRRRRGRRCPCRPTAEEQARGAVVALACVDLLRHVGRSLRPHGQGRPVGVRLAWPRCPRHPNRPPSRPHRARRHRRHRRRGDQAALGPQGGVQDRPAQAVDQERPWCSPPLPRGRARPGRRAGQDAPGVRGLLPRASAVYFLNDANDYEADRLHPTKTAPPHRRRPTSIPAPPASSPACSCAVAGGHRAGQRRQAHRRHRRLPRPPVLLHDVAQVRAGDRPRRGRPPGSCCAPSPVASRRVSRCPTGS